MRDAYTVEGEPRLKVLDTVHLGVQVNFCKELQAVANVTSPNT